MIDGHYTKDQIKKAKRLLRAFAFKMRYKNGSHYYITGLGDKTKEGMINTILEIMYLKE